MEQLQLLYLENESYHLVDALPYIDTDYGASAEISMAVRTIANATSKLRECFLGLGMWELQGIQVSLRSVVVFLGSNTTTTQRAR